MQTVGIVVSILAGIVLLIVLYFLLKPYVIKHDTTILFTGGLGSGKTLESVKQAIVLIRKNRLLKVELYNFNNKWINPLRKIRNKLRENKYKRLEEKKGDLVAIKYKTRKPQLKYRKDRKQPILYSNIPIHFKKHIFGFEKEWSTKLTIEHILLLKEINEYSVVVIDEFPQFISQFDWDIDLVQKNANEFITFFRHYIGGYLIINAQSEDEIECHFRRKLNQGVFCTNFHAWPFSWCPIFYTNRMCDYIISENIQTMSTTYMEENTKIHFGLFPRNAYDSRCYRVRYDNIHLKVLSTAKWSKLQTYEVLRLKKYISPLDTATTPQQKEKMLELAKKIKERNNDNEIK